MLLERGNAGLRLDLEKQVDPETELDPDRWEHALLDTEARRAALRKMGWRRLAYLATLVATVTILGAALLLPPPDAEPDFGIAIGVWALTLSVAIAGVAIPTRWLHHAIQSLELVVTVEVSPIGDYRSLKKSRRVVDLDAAALRRVEWVTRTPFAVSMVLPLVLGVLGLTLHRMGHEPLVCIPIVVSSVVLAASRYPTDSRLIRAVSDALEASIRG